MDPLLERITSGDDSDMSGFAWLWAVLDRRHHSTKNCGSWFLDTEVTFDLKRRPKNLLKIPHCQSFTVKVWRFRVSSKK